MIESGEDPMFIARRLVILAAEDIGLAEPQALSVAVAAQQAVHFIGMPEGRIPLAEATVFLATAPKSNTAYMGLERAMEDVRGLPNEPVPLHLRNAVTGLNRDMGYGKGYRYAHDHPGHLRSRTSCRRACKADATSNRPPRAWSRRSRSVCGGGGEKTRSRRQTMTLDAAPSGFAGRGGLPG
jgi:putative ATPase